MRTLPAAPPSTERKGAIIVPTPHAQPPALGVDADQGEEPQARNCLGGGEGAMPMVRLAECAALHTQLFKEGCLHG